MNVNAPKNNLYNSPKVQCVEYTHNDGSKYYVRVSIPNKNANTRRSVRERLLASIPLYTHETFFTASDGVFTWILSDKGFFASPVFSVFEHGTLHMNLADRTSAAHITAAGEAMKTGSRLSFNLLSGTYTRHILESEGADATEKMETDMKDFFTSLGFTEIDTSNKRTFITGIPSESELQMYASAGYDVLLYKTKDACSGMKRFTIKQRIDAITKQLTEPMFAAEKWQTKLGNEKLQAEAELAALDANVPKRFVAAGGGTRRPRRHRRHTRRLQRFRR